MFTEILYRLSLYLSILTLLSCNAPIIDANKTPPGELRAQKISDLPFNDKPQQVQFVDEKEGWLIADDKLWVSTDGGLSWSVISSGANDKKVEKIQVLRSGVGWALRSNYLYKTEDRGRTWSHHISPMPANSDGEIRAFTFLANDKVGWAVGGKYRPLLRGKTLSNYPNNAISADSKSVLYGAIFRTDDGGATWAEQPASREAGRFLDISFWDDSHGLAFGDTGIMYSDDGGKSWSEVDFSEQCTKENQIESTEGIPITVSLLLPQSAWLSFNDGRIAKSADGGKSWCDIVSPQKIWPSHSYNSHFQKITFLDPDYGLGLSGEGIVYESGDGGKTWAKLNLNTRFEDVFLLNASKGWMIAKGSLFNIVFGNSRRKI